MGNSESIRTPPPMKIHKLHGKFLKVSQDRLSAKRIEGYADSMFFGSRTVEKEEKIEIILTEMTSNWNGSIRFGFTLQNPIDIVNHPEGIPRFMCPDLIKRGGTFVESLNHIKLLPGDRILFWITNNGELKLSINDVEQRSQVSKLITSPVWPVVDVYGNTVGIKFKSLSDDPDQLLDINEARFYSALNFTEMEIIGNIESVDIFNKICSKRKDFIKSFTWNYRPLNLNHIWVIFIDELDEYTEYETTLAISLSPPGRIIPNNLLDLPSRPLIFNNFYHPTVVGDELAICIINDGEVMVALNGEEFKKIGQVLRSEFYWLITDLNCVVKSFVSLGTFPLTGHSLPALPNIEGSLPRERNQVIEHNDIPESNLSVPENLQSFDGTFQSLSLEPEPLQIKCIKCKTEKPDSVFVECGDICCCFNCASAILRSNKKCPKCDKAFTKMIKVYF